MQPADQIEEELPILLQRRVLLGGDMHKHRVNARVLAGQLVQRLEVDVVAEIPAWVLAHTQLVALSTKFTTFLRSVQTADRSVLHFKVCYNWKVWHMG